MSQFRIEEEIITNETGKILYLGNVYFDNIFQQTVKYGSKAELEDFIQTMASAVFKQ